MAKNNTQKLLKAIVYLTTAKGYSFSIYNNKWKPLLPTTNDPQIIKDNYKKYSSGYIGVATSAVISPPNTFYIYYNIASDIIASNYKDGKDFLYEAQFLVNIYQS